MSLMLTLLEDRYNALYPFLEGDLGRPDFGAPSVFAHPSLNDFIQFITELFLSAFLSITYLCP